MSGLRLWLLHLFEWLLLGLGLGCLGIYAYENVEARRFQAEQTAVFERDASAAKEVADIRTGSLIGMLDVPRLELSTPVIQGDDTRTLKRAVGHLPDTPMPWDEGNSAVAGHRDTFFRAMRNVRLGDDIAVATPRGTFHYRVTRLRIVAPQDLSVLQPSGGIALTLITCYPFTYVGNAPKRYIVQAVRRELAPG